MPPLRAYEVAVAAPVPGSLTYSSPAQLPVGIRVLVPLGSRLVTGYVLAGLVDAASLPAEVKAVADCLDAAPIFPAQLVPFFRWLADYYHHPLGEVIRTALPAGSAANSGQEAVLTETGRLHLPATMEALAPQPWMVRLLAKGSLSPATVRTVKRHAAALLRAWQNKGWLELKDTAIEPPVKSKTETVVRLCAPLPEQPANLLKQSEQKTLELFYQHCGGSQVLPRRSLTTRYAGAGKALKGLAEAGLVLLEERQVYRDPFGELLPCSDRPEALTVEQAAALNELVAAMDAARFQPFLLHGVTGSGKTEVYLRAAEHCLSQGRNVLVLVPELALAAQLEGQFYSRFGDCLAVLHSGLSEGQRFDQWQRILRGQARIALGARSAVFAPFASLGLVLVDEEHEPAYKQDDGLRYNGRDMAVLRARFASCPVLLGSATPSVSSFYQAEQGRCRLLSLAKRIQNQALPKVEIVDLSKEPRFRQDWFFSDRLLAALRDNLAKGLQSLLFVNRRGYAAFMLCRDCGAVVRCRHCRVSLTLHRGRNRLICHYCGYSLRPDIVCPDCGSADVAGLGLGSERVEAEVRRLFPQARVARLDSDTARNRRTQQTILRQVRAEEVDILVGTQMVAKGLHFPKMTLVGVVWADSSLSLPDYKAAERTFQLLAQVTGRAGRGEYPGRVLIQTHQPGHYALEAARCHDYQAMYQQETALRGLLGYPPFGRLINIRFSGEEEAQVEATAKAAEELLQAGIAQDCLPAELLGPAPAPLSRLRNRYRWQLLLKGRQPEVLHRLCTLLLENKQQLCRSSVRLGIDVDPENML